MADIADVFWEQLTDRIKVDQLYPPFAALVRRLVTALEGREARFYATSGLRTVEEQDALFAKGGVTKARGGYSAHNYSCAVDLCHDLDVNRPGLQPDYTAASYDVLGEEAAKLGLEWGGRWESFPDRPHVQLPLKAHGLAWKDLLKLYGKGGLPAVWARLDRETWGPAPILIYGPPAPDEDQEKPEDPVS